MQKVEVSRVFPADPRTVWDHYTDHRSWSEWAGLGHVTLDRTGTPPPNGVGCVRVFTTAGMRVCEEVLTFEPPRRMTYRLLKGAVPLRNHLGEVVFEPHEQGTRVTWRCQFDSSVPGLGGLSRRLISKMFANVLERLAGRLVS